jgi:HK97 family phage portal protein
VRVLVDAAASVPLISYRRTQEGRVRADGRLADLLTQPAPATTQSALIGQAVAHLNLYGGCYLGKFRDAGGRVDALALLHPDRVRPEIVAGRPRYVVTGPKGERSTHGVEDVLHVRAPLSLDGLTGLSPIKQCRVALGLAEGLGEHALAFFRNGARPSGVLSVPSGLSGGPEQQDTLLAGLREDLSNSYTGTKNSHKIAIMAGDLTWTQLSGPLDDLQFVEQRRLSTADIARIFRVPAHMVNAQTGDSMTYANVEHESLDFVTHSLRPHLVCIEQAISNDDDLAPGPLYVEFLLDALLRADSKTRSEIYAAALDPITGWMTRAEVRRLENLPAEPDPPAASPAAPIPIREAA